jgi:hypothetical protein
VKLHFGSPFRRRLRGGVRLSIGEQAVLSALVERLPADLRAIVEAQFDAYDLVQREIDGRALNFYCRPARNKTLPLLAMDVDECPLTRITFTFGGPGSELHAALVAVRGRAFCVTLGARLDGVDEVSNFSVTKTIDSWRSNMQRSL